MNDRAGSGIKATGINAPQKQSDYISALKLKKKEKIKKRNEIVNHHQVSQQ
jgi:hypothetical protein